MIVQSPRELEIGSVVHSGGEENISFYDRLGQHQTGRFAMLVIREATRDEYLLELRKDTDISVIQYAASYQNSGIPGARFYEVSMD